MDESIKILIQMELMSERRHRGRKRPTKTRQTNMRRLSHVFSFNPLQDVRMLERNGER